MTLSNFVARQLGNPTGIIGSFAGWTWNRRNAALNDTVLDLLALQPTDRVLEIGFGGGYLLQRMASIVSEGWLAGVDQSPAMVSYAEKYNRHALKAGRLELYCAPAEALPFADRSFNKICSVNSIFYWQNIEQGIQEIARIMVVNGKAVLCFTSKGSLEKKGFAKNIKLVDHCELESIMKENGLHAINSASFSDPYRQYTCIIGQK